LPKMGPRRQAASLEGETVGPDVWVGKDKAAGKEGHDIAPDKGEGNKLGQEKSSEREGKGSTESHVCRLIPTATEAGGGGQRKKKSASGGLGIQ